MFLLGELYVFLKKLLVFLEFANQPFVVIQIVESCLIFLQSLDQTGIRFDFFWYFIILITFCCKIKKVLLLPSRCLVSFWAQTFLLEFISCLQVWFLLRKRLLINEIEFTNPNPELWLWLWRNRIFGYNTRPFILFIIFFWAHNVDFVSR